MRRLLIIASMVCSAVFTVWALAASDIEIADAWTRASAPGQKVAGVYFRITSNVDARLVGVEVQVAGAAELHFMSMEDGVMRMRAVPGVDLPAGKTVAFKPGGYHVMLFDLQRPLEAGEIVQIGLVVEDDGAKQRRIGVPVEVRNLDGSEAGHRHH